MVVLDQNAVRKIKPVVLPAATTDRIFIDSTQARNGLAGVQNLRFRARDRLHELARKGGDTAHALHKVQYDALAR
jgi:hypothetical protein